MGLGKPMKWWMKIGAFKALSLTPGGSALYRWFQENITGSLVPTSERVAQKIDVGLRYYRFLQSAQAETLLSNGRHVDIGSGWHPTIPLLFYCLGCHAQTLADVVPVMTGKTASQTSATFGKIVLAGRYPELQAERLARLGTLSWKDWPPRELGWEYRAPYMGWLAEQSSALDLATSTQALLHVPRGVLASIFRLVHQSLKPGGFFLATVHLRDLFADADPGITPYNHLRYSPWVWDRLICSSLMSYNRLKAPDYRHLLLEAGFKIREFQVDPGQPDLLEKIQIHPCFRSYSQEDLSAFHLFWAAQKS